jgi:signal transduction histidine kinase
MRQVFLNLFKNSIAAVGVGGRITIAFESVRTESGAWARMRFSDDGCGIPLDNPDEVFLPFVTSRAEGGRNHGLGLFIVFGIVEKYGGAIHVRNLDQGGCEFTIMLPLAELETPAPPVQ